MSDTPGLSYRDAGVDLDAADRAKESLKTLVSSTRDAHTLSEMGTAALSPSRAVAPAACRALSGSVEAMTIN